jgi:hypothetical protein
MRSPSVRFDPEPPAVDGAAAHWLELMAAFGTVAAIVGGLTVACWGALHLLRVW